jgi:outer membrane receptor protein involved in Fe transport
VNRSTLIETAGFVDLRYNLTSALKVIGGVRVSGIQTKFFRFTDGPLNGGPMTVPLTTVSETPVSPRFGLSYELGDTMFYATAAKGFRPGGTNGVIPEKACAADLANAGQSGPPASYQSDSVWSYEAGSKGNWFAQRLRVNADLYYIKWRNIQQSLNLPTCGFAYEANLGSATSKGGELEIQAQVTDGFTVGMNVGYDDARFDNNVFGGKNPNTGVAALLTRAGDRIIYVPDWTLSAHAQYQHEFLPSYLTYFRIDYQYRGSYANTTSAGTANFDAATFNGTAYDVLNLRVGVHHRNVDVSVFMNNALDGTPVTSLNDQLVPVTKAPLFITTLRPRTIGVTATGTF